MKKQILHEAQYLRLVREGHWEYIERVNVTGIVGILAVTVGDKIILNEQHRVALGRRCIELPAGLVGDVPNQNKEDLVGAAKRELYEETGYEAKDMEFLTQSPPSAGLSSEIITFYRARGLEKKGKGGGDSTEDITVHEVPLNQIEEWLKKKEEEGVLIDPKVYVGLYYARSLSENSLKTACS